MILPLKRTLIQSAAIVLLGCALGLAANKASTRQVPSLTQKEDEARAPIFLPLARAKELWNTGGAFFLDARPPVDFAAGHIGNAINLPAHSFEKDFPAIASRLTPASYLVLYCDGEECDLSQTLAKSLHLRGYTNTHLLLNGWTAWKQAGYAASRKR